MNLVLIEASDFIEENRVRLHGRRLLHVIQVHRATEGKRLRVGVLNGMVGEGRIEPAQVGEIVASLDRTRAGQTAPAHGLTLVEVLYEPSKTGGT